LPFNINVGVVYPPDTDTPGLAKENAQKVSKIKAVCMNLTR